MEIEGIAYTVDWNSFKKGSSFFIPCNHPVKAKKTITITLKRLKMSVATKVVVEDGVKGLRIWRT